MQVESAAHQALMKALWADTAFLAGQGVMDYSLLVGVDSPNGALVVGIIDFLRQVKVLCGSIEHPNRSFLTSSIPDCSKTCSRISRSDSAELILQLHADNNLEAMLAEVTFRLDRALSFVCSTPGIRRLRGGSSQ